MNLLLDTNVIIDYLGCQKPYFDPAMKVVAAGFFGDASLWMAAGSAKDAFYVLNHFVDSCRIQSALLELFKVVRPVSLTAEDLERAARLQWDDFEDCLIAVSALKAQADYIITRDARGFERSMVPVQTPEEWLVAMESKGITYTEVTM